MKPQCLALLAVMVVVGCGSVEPSKQDGATVTNMSQDAGSDTVAQAPEPNSGTDAAMSTPQPDAAADSQPNQLDSGQPPSCAPTGVCHQCPHMVTCPLRSDGVWLCCDGSGVPFCDTHKCTVN